MRDQELLTRLGPRLLRGDLRKPFLLPHAVEVALVIHPKHLPKLAEHGRGVVFELALLPLLEDELDLGKVIEVVSHEGVGRLPLLEVRLEEGCADALDQSRHEHVAAALRRDNLPKLGSPSHLRMCEPLISMLLRDFTPDQRRLLHKRRHENRLDSGIFLLFPLLPLPLPLLRPLGSLLPHGCDVTEGCLLGLCIAGLRVH
mmetsp:Transcript_29383/g.57522  ORF Transcript_29383/g.57522 Transcript_29383/m.57522 type:complete len:201 (-) Transcript_29383:73-675(-)